MQKYESTIRKVTDGYSPEIYRQKLDERFGENLAVIERVKKMTKTQLSVFAALCDGKTFTTAGYYIDADYGVKRASAVALSPDKRYSNPVTRSLVETKVGAGGSTKQALFLLLFNELVIFDKDHEVFFNDCRKDISRREASQAQRDVKRLLKEFGKAGLVDLLDIFDAVNDVSLPEENVG